MINGGAGFESRVLGHEGSQVFAGAFVVPMRDAACMT